MVFFFKVKQHIVHLRINPCKKSHVKYHKRDLKEVTVRQAGVLLSALLTAYVSLSSSNLRLCLCCYLRDAEMRRGCRGGRTLCPFGRVPAAAHTSVLSQCLLSTHGSGRGLRKICGTFSVTSGPLTADLVPSFCMGSGVSTFG